MEDIPIQSLMITLISLWDMLAAVEYLESQEKYQAGAATVMRTGLLSIATPNITEIIATT